jgi:hypothetical protein
MQHLLCATSQRLTVCFCVSNQRDMRQRTFWVPKSLFYLRMKHMNREGHIQIDSTNT